MKIETQIVQRVTRAMHCSECGVEAAAACDCGAPYVPAGVAAANAVAAHPEKSDRAIAKALGVSPTTVGKARQLSSTGQLVTAENSAVDTRVGLDGKARKQPVPKPVKPDPRIISSKLADQVGRFANDLILCDRLLARELANIIMLPGVRERLSADLTNGLALLGNDADPDSSERTL